MKFLFLLTCFLLFMTTSIQSSHIVYLIHGYAGWGSQMNQIKRTIEKENGFVCVNFSYKSMTDDIDSVAQQLYRKILSDKADTISFITHSMGALVVRSMYQHIDKNEFVPIIHRFVMIAPPNQGSPVADFVTRYKLLRNIGGPNLENLTTDEKTGAPRYPIPTCEIGLIVGVKGDTSGYNPLIEGDNDGLVQLTRTTLGVEKDLLLVKSLHQTILSKREVRKQCLVFLKSGCFNP